jgi:hypothetical protein
VAFSPHIEFCPIEIVDDYKLGVDLDYEMHFLRKLVDFGGFPPLFIPRFCAYTVSDSM